MLRFLLLIAILLAPLGLPADEPKKTAAEQERELAERAERFFQPLIEHQWAQAIVVGVVDERGNHVYGFGRRWPDKDDRPDGDTLFEIGSITKTFTGVLLADMVERGLMKLDDPVNKYLPDDIGPLKCGSREMRLVDLATHSSGLPRMPSNWKPNDMAEPYADYTTENLHEFLKRQAKPDLAGSLQKLLAGQGKPKFAYSNVGVGLLGHLLERKAESSYEELLQERILKPLEMNSTRLKLDDALAPRLIAGHDGDGNPIKPWEFDCLGPCGGIRSSANDMLKYVAANLELRDSPLLAALRKSHEPQFHVSDELDIGLNWFLTKPDWISHGGMTGGYNSQVLFSKPKKLGLVVLADTTIVGGLSLEKMSFDFLQAVADGAPGTPPKVRLAVKVDPATLDKYVGSYILVPVVSTFTITREEDRLYVQLTGQPRLRVYPENDTKFFYKAVDAQIDFETDEDGSVRRLVLHQNGKDMAAGRFKPPAKEAKP
jgi:CubicO group peptidase (beta-lactamase class C family)